MKASQVTIGDEYSVKVSGKLARVRLTSTSPHGGWNGTNVATGRDVRIRTAARLRANLSAVDRDVARGAALDAQEAAARFMPNDDDDEPQGGILSRPGVPGGPRVAIPVTKHVRPGSAKFEPVDDDRDPDGRDDPNAFLQDEPQVFVGLQTETRFATFCDLGRHVVKRTHRYGGKGCGTVACACAADEDVSFRPATDEEADGFWRAMDGLAADASCRY
jgi:hypothetical protein